MLYVITGGSGSGKSEYAESVAVCAHERIQKRHEEEMPQKACGKKGQERPDPAGGLYYVATMKPYDRECLERIDRHRRMRAQKGFSTIECYTHVKEIKAQKGDVLLLECMSNLMANERYLEEGQIKGEADEIFDRAERAVVEPLLSLEKEAGCVVIVTNEVFSDGMHYEEESQTYCRLLGFVNQRLAAAADSVVEVVCSIPVCQKGELPCSDL